MKKWRERLVVSCVLVLVGSYAWVHRPHVAPATNAQESATLPLYAEQEQAVQSVSVSGPLADYMSRVKAAGVETLQPISSTVLQSGSHRTVASDHVSDDSPVGTSTLLLHRTFNVARIVDLPFDLPAHASTPKLRGTYRSFLPRNGTEQGGVDDAGVEFLLLNEQQFADLIDGRPGNALFSADDASNSEVNFTMPPTFGKPVKYHLVFRNNSPSSGKRAVQADFRIDF